MPPHTQTTIMALRHGETLWNIEDRFQGHEDSPLTEIGRKQVAALGQRLKGSHIDILVSSDLGRARASAEIIAEITGQTVQTDSRLRERHYGLLEGMNLAEISTVHPEILKLFNGDDPDYVIPGGESHRMLYERNVAWIEEMLASRPGATIVIVVHGGVLDSLFRHVARLPLAQPRCFVTSNASMSVFDHGQFYGTQRWVIRTWGDTAHLAGIGFRLGLG